MVFSLELERELFITTLQETTGELTTDMAKGNMISESGALISTKSGVLDIISAQKGARVSNTTKQRSSMYGSAAQRHKYSSRYDKETTRAATCTVSIAYSVGV